MTNPRLSQNERIRRKLARDGFVTRNECLRQFPAITRLGARIKDLEKQGYRFKPAWRGNDYVYTIDVNPNAPARQLRREEHIAYARQLVAEFDRALYNQQELSKEI